MTFLYCYNFKISGITYSLPACEQWELPNKYLDGLWESIVAPPHIKNQMIGYCDTSVRFSDANVDSNIITWNRMALLYGPPGTGKTTICKVSWLKSLASGIL
jgi:hypothetical protein